MEFPLSSTDLHRLKWNCRRGLLENDLVLEKFVERDLQTLNTEQVEAFRFLLALEDGDLWDLVSGRAELTPKAQARPGLSDVLSLLRRY
jgi:antitoxin CptB